MASGEEDEVEVVLRADPRGGAGLLKIPQNLQLHFLQLIWSNRIHRQTPSSRALPPTHTETVVEAAAPAPAPGGPLTRGPETKRCPDSEVQLSNILARMSPSFNRREAANCQLLCPHYPRPPAQTGALGHCPRNHSAPVAHKES